MTESPALAVVPHPPEDWRVVPCGSCGTEGRIYFYDRNNPDPEDWGECQYCEGTGGEMVPVFPIEMGDLC